MTVQSDGRASLSVRLLALCAAIAGLSAFAGLPAQSPRVAQLYFGTGSMALLPLAGLVLCCIPVIFTIGRTLRVACGAIGIGVALVMLATQPLRSLGAGDAGLFALGTINVLVALLGGKPGARLALRLAATVPVCIGAFALLQALTSFSLAAPEDQGIGTVAALVLILLGAALFADLAPDNSLSKDATANANANRILATACGALIVMVALARLTAMAFTHRSAETFNHAFVSHSQSELAHAIAGELGAAGAQARAVLDARDTAQLLRAAQQPGVLAKLQDTARLLRERGASFVAYRVANRELFASGKPASTQLVAPLADGVGRELVYSQGFVLRMRVPMRDAQGVAGEVLVETPVPGIQERLDALRLALSGSAVQLCALRGSPLVCFPTDPKQADQKVTAGAAVVAAMQDAARGNSSSATVDVDDGRQYLTASGPVENLGLGLLLARDWQVILAPLRFQMLFGLAMLVFASALAIMLMRARVLPLVRTLVAARQTAEASEARFLAASENSPDGFTVMEAVRDARGAIVDFRLNYQNAASARMWRAPPGRVLGMLMSRLMPEAVELGVHDKYRHVVETGETLLEESPVITPGVPAEWVEFQVVRLNDGIAITTRDISERKRAEGRLQQMAQSDVLTGLPNRAVFYDRLDHAMMRARRTRRPMALMFMDIDHFKAINDSHGHAGGDALLKKFAERLRREVRKADTVARLAGDEFTVILEELHDRADADKIANQILKAVSMPLQIGAHELRITSSIGIALYEGENTSANELLDRADIALYAVKRAGRNASVTYSTDIDTRGGRETPMEVTCLSGTFKQG